tara:strand:- start:96 stop:1172 length:1077 start_codon:yes stop_codon:yes gene_type:complete
MSNNCNFEQCIHEFLAFQHVYSNIKWTEGVYNRSYDEYTECPRNNLVSNGKEAVDNLFKLKNKLFKNYKHDEVGILISSGIDSATIAKLMPENSYAFYATYVERDIDPEIEIVKKYCKINNLNLVVVNISWNDYISNMDYLMKVKKNPIHPCEIPVYMCCLKAKELNIKLLTSGWGADTHFGGMDKLISKDWNFDDFKKRYEYCPRINKNNTLLDKTYDKFINKNGIVDIQQFLTFNYHIMTIKSFFYIPELCGLIHLPLWGYLGINGNLNLDRIRNGESKYVIREAFKLLYKDDNVDLTNKIPFTRPTDIYMKKYFNDYDYFDTLKEYIENNNNLSSQQKWMIYCLNRFIKNVLNYN